MESADQGDQIQIFLKGLIKSHSHPNGLYWGHQRSWTLTPANSTQVSNMQYEDYNRK